MGGSVREDLGGFRGPRRDSAVQSLHAYSHTSTQTIVSVCGITRSRYLLEGSRGALQRRNACVGLVYLRIPLHLNLLATPIGSPPPPPTFSYR